MIQKPWKYFFLYIYSPVSIVRALQYPNVSLNQDTQQGNFALVFTKELLHSGKFPFLPYHMAVGPTKCITG